MTINEAIKTLETIRDEHARGGHLELFDENTFMVKSFTVEGSGHFHPSWNMPPNFVRIENI